MSFIKLGGLYTAVQQLICFQYKYLVYFWVYELLGGVVNAIMVLFIVIKNWLEEQESAFTVDGIQVYACSTGGFYTKVLLWFAKLIYGEAAIDLMLFRDAIDLVYGNPIIIDAFIFADI